MVNPLEQVLTLNEAAERFNFDSSTLRHYIKLGKFEPDEFRKSGNVWLITLEAMRKHYGYKEIKSQRMNQYWVNVVLKEEVLPELELVAKAQEIYKLGMGLPPGTKVVEDFRWGNMEEVVILEWVYLNKEGDYEEDWTVRAMNLNTPENIPQWAVLKGMTAKEFQQEFRKFVEETIPEMPWQMRHLTEPITLAELEELRKKEPLEALQVTMQILLDMSLTIGEP